MSTSSFMRLANDGGCGNDNSPQEDGRGLNALAQLVAKAIKDRLSEEIVDEILPKPTIAELEKMMDEAEKGGREFGNLLPDGSICRSHKKPVFASDLADAALCAIWGAGFEIVLRKPINAA